MQVRVPFWPPARHVPSHMDPAVVHIWLGAHIPAPASCGGWFMPPAPPGVPPVPPIRPPEPVMPPVLMMTTPPPVPPPVLPPVPDEPPPAPLSIVELPPQP